VDLGRRPIRELVVIAVVSFAIAAVGGGAAEAQPMPLANLAGKWSVSGESTPCASYTSPFVTTITISPYYASGSFHGIGQTRGGNWFTLSGVETVETGNNGWQHVSMTDPTGLSGASLNGILTADETQQGVLYGTAMSLADPTPCYPNSYVIQLSKVGPVTRAQVLMDTQTEIFEILQDVTSNKAKTQDRSYKNWDKYIQGNAVSPTVGLLTPGTLDATITSPGSITGAATVHTITIAHGKQKFSKAGSARLHIPFTTAGRAFIKRYLAAVRKYLKHHPGGLHPPTITVKVRVTYT
jgi:hypothetical protein